MDQRVTKQIIDFQKAAVKMNPNDADTHYERGRTYGEQSQYEEPLGCRIIQNALDSDPRIPLGAGPPS